MNRTGFNTAWPTHAEAQEMNAAAEDVRSAVASAALVLGNLVVEGEEGKHRGEDGRALILALVETCALALRRTAEKADAVSTYAGAVSDAAFSIARKEAHHADQP